MKTNNQALNIRNNAIELFYNVGYKKTTLREIAKKSGIDHSSIFYYYKNKSEIAKYFLIRYFTGSIRHNYELCSKIFESRWRYEEVTMLFYGLHYMRMATDKALSNFFIDFYYDSKAVFNKITDLFQMNFYQEIGNTLASESDQNNLPVLNYALTSQVDIMLIEFCLNNTISPNEAAEYFATIVSNLPQMKWEVSIDEIKKFYAEYQTLIETDNFDIFSNCLICEQNDNPEEVVFYDHSMITQ